MNCSWSEERFESYLDGALRPREVALLAGHLGACATCHDLLDEVRAVDALLLTPRQIELAPNFTYATMAEVRSLPLPRRTHPPAGAYVLSFLVVTWILVGAAFVLAPAPAHLWLAATIDLARAFADALGGIAGSVGRTGVPYLIALAIAADVVVACSVTAAVVLIRPRIAERLRS